MNKPCNRNCKYLLKGYCKKYNKALEPIDDETYFKECKNGA